MPFKDILIYSSGSPFAQQSETICANLVNGAMRNNSVKLFLICANGSLGNAF